MRNQRYVRNSGSFIGDQLKADLGTAKSLVGAVLAGLLLMLIGFKLMPEDATPLTAKVMCLLSLTIAAGGVGAYLGRNIVGWLPAIGLFILAMIGIFIVKAAGGGFIGIGLLMGWGVIMGMTLGPFLASVVTEEGPGIVIQSLTGTTAVMIITGAIAMYSGINFTFLGPILLIALIGLIVVGLVGIFVKFSRTVNLLYSIIGMVVFSGFFLLKFFRLNNSENTWDQAVSATVGIYITFVNFFIYLLQFLMFSRRK